MRDDTCFERNHSFGFGWDWSHETYNKVYSDTCNCLFRYLYKKTKLIVRASEPKYVNVTMKIVNLF